MTKQFPLTGGPNLPRPAPAGEPATPKATRWTLSFAEQPDKFGDNAKDLHQVAYETDQEYAYSWEALREAMDQGIMPPGQVNVSVKRLVNMTIAVSPGRAGSLMATGGTISGAGSYPPNHPWYNKATP